MKEGDKYMTAPDNRDLTKPKVAPFSNSWRTGADKKGSITMNEKTTAFIKSIAAAKAAERDFKEVNAAASATITEANKVMTDTIPVDRVEEITRGAAELLPDTNMVVVWVSNGSECACASSVFFPNVGTSSTTWVLGSARLDEVSAEYTAKLLADAGALGYIDSDTETDIFSDEFEEVNEVVASKERIIKAVQAAAADTANADNCIANYHYTVESVDDDGKDVKKLSIVFEN